MLAAVALAAGLLTRSIAGASLAAGPTASATDAPVPTARTSPPPLGDGRTYHVDCLGGRDNADGRHASTAWRSLDRANRAKLKPGDNLLLLRGCRWKGPLLVTRSGTQDAPITIGAYGEGALPIIEDAYQNIFVTGDWFVIQDVHVRADPPTYDLRCDRQPAGVRYGIYVESGSQHGVIRHILATELFTGVRIARGASDHQILDSEFRDNDMKSNVSTSDSGAIAIDLQGDSNVVARNRISGSDACSRFFDGRDGSAISVYGGRHNVIHHNFSNQDHDFVELGNPRTDDTLIAYNVDHSTLPGANFAVVHGLGSRYGPVHDTRIVHNTSVLTGAGSIGIECSHAPTGNDLTIAGNIVWGEEDAVTCSGGLLESDNIYWSSDGRPQVTFEMAPTSRKTDPRLVDPQGGDLRLLPDSPAIDAIRPMDLGAIGAVDAAGVPIPQGYAPDIGAYEYTSDPQPTITPEPTDPSTPIAPPTLVTSPTPEALGGSPALMSPSITPTPTLAPSPTHAPSPTPAPTATPAPTPTPRVTPTPQPRPSGPADDVPPPTGGPGALDQLILLVGVLGAGGLLAADPAGTPVTRLGRSAAVAPASGRG